MRISIDSNILVYAVDARDPRIATARRVVTGATVADCVLTNQVIGEFLNVVRAKTPITVAEGRRTAADWALLFPLAATSADQLIAASALAEQHRLQFWDSVILSVCAGNGVDYLITEDMHDGALIGGVRIMNPFNPANAELLDLLLTPAPGTGDAAR